MHTDCKSFYNIGMKRWPLFPTLQIIKNIYFCILNMNHHSFLHHHDKKIIYFIFVLPLASKSWNTNFQHDKQTAKHWTTRCANLSNKTHYLYWMWNRCKYIYHQNIDEYMAGKINYNTCLYILSKVRSIHKHWAPNGRN